MIRRPPRATLFPSTTLFRSCAARSTPAATGRLGHDRALRDPSLTREGDRRPLTASPLHLLASSSTAAPLRWTDGRSEEHTSELQSRQYLVCRLLLEKKTEFCTSAQSPTATLPSESTSRTDTASPGCRMARNPGLTWSPRSTKPSFVIPARIAS